MSARTRRLLGNVTVALATVLAIAMLVGNGLPARAVSVHHAGVVVRHGDGRMAYAYVGFTEDSISGIDLLKRTGLDIVTIAFGGLGEGVCSIDEHGCPASNCRKRVCQGPKADDPFWQYFRQTQPGDWQALVLGASATRVHDGDLDGWSWTGTTPQLPPLTLAEVAKLAGSGGGVSAGSPGTTTGALLYRDGAPRPTEQGPSTATIALAAAIIVVALALVGWSVRRRRTRTAGPP